MVDTKIFIFLLNIVAIYALPGLFNGFGLKHITDNIQNYAGNYSAAVDPNTTIKWIEEPLDHFDSKEKRTFKMQYFENLKYWKPNSPIFLSIGGEGGAPAFRVTYMSKLAAETNGAMYLTVHRYYGQSFFLNTSLVANLKYLSAEQAMADVAHLLKEIKSQPEFKLSKVVVVGGSYAGMLAAWMRVKYPHIVDIAWASSAPVLAKKDFFEYYEKITEASIKPMPGCYEKAVKQFSRYDKLLKTADGIKQLKKEENICERVDMTKPLNKATFISCQIDRFHCDRPNDTAAPMGGNGHCFDYEFSSYVMSPENLYWRTWIYQTCTEFGFFATTNSDKQPFTRYLILDFYVKTCSLVFGPEFDEKRIDDGIAYTNKQYGGLTPNVTQVVFTNGDTDPWSELGIKKSLSKDAPAIYIRGSTHCQDLHIGYSYDPPDLTKAREDIKVYILRWLGSK